MFSAGHAFAGRQGLAGGWPVVGVITTGLLFGPALGILAGVTMATGRVVSVVANGLRSFDSDQVASLAATVVFFAVFGGVAGWVGRLLRQAEHEVAVARPARRWPGRCTTPSCRRSRSTARRTSESDPVLARLLATPTGSCASSSTDP